MTSSQEIQGTEHVKQPTGMQAAALGLWKTAHDKSSVSSTNTGEDSLQIRNDLKATPAN